MREVAGVQSGGRHGEKLGNRLGGALEKTRAATPGGPVGGTVGGPVGVREITWQSVTGALLISSVVAASYPYVVLKLGMGPNVSVVSAVLGAVFLNITAFKTRGRNRHLNNVIQTAGTSASSTAFMCVIAAAFGYLDRNETAAIHVHISPWAMFSWLTCSGAIGVVFTVLFRRHFLDDPQMVFADGVAAAETIEVLDSDPHVAREKIRALGLAALVSAAVDWLREGMALLPTLYFSLPYRAGIEWGLLNAGSGLLVGLNVGLSMLLGTVVIAAIIGPWLVHAGIAEEIVRSQIAERYWEQCQAMIGASAGTEQAAFLSAHCAPLVSFRAGDYFATVLLWAMWPATALMVASAAAAVLLKWRAIVATFRSLRSARADTGEDMSLAAIAAWALLMTLALAWIQRAHFGMSLTQTAVAVLASLPLMLVGIRVLGETNNGPVSAMSNALQALFAALWPSHIGLNLIAAGMAGNTSSQAEGTIQDYKTGKLIGSTPRILTYTQLAAVPIGAAAVAIMYPFLIGKYGLGAEGLSAPTGLKIANMAVLLSRGTAALPRYALAATLIAAVAGVAIAIIHEVTAAPWTRLIPSVAGFGFALILPGELNIPTALGGIGGWLWMRISPDSYGRYAVTVASGMIVGEALLGGLLLPVLAALNVKLG
jgi:OPT family oligopeptide transporter